MFSWGEIQRESRQCSGVVLSEVWYCQDVTYELNPEEFLQNTLSINFSGQRQFSIW